MKVIILKELKKLGKAYDVVEVKDGYGRNYLIPSGFALLATDANFKKLETLKQREQKHFLKQKDEALQLKSKLEGLSPTILAQVKEEEEIFGSVGQQEILKALKAENIELAKKTIILDEPIKKLGVYTVKVHLFADVDADLKVWVVKK